MMSLALAEDSLLHYATDGESYGHHHRYGEMALAYCFQTLDEMEGIEPINYATIFIVFHQRIKSVFTSLPLGPVFMEWVDGLKIVGV